MNGARRVLSEGVPALVVDDPKLLTDLRVMLLAKSRGSAHRGRGRLAWCDDLARAIDGVVEMAQVHRAAIKVPQSELISAGGASHRAQWVSTSEAATILGISDRAVRKRAVEGRVQATRTGGRWIVCLPKTPERRITT